MAKGKRTANLAGLATLAALGSYFASDRKKSPDLSKATSGYENAPASFEPDSGLSKATSGYENAPYISSRDMGDEAPVGSPKATAAPKAAATKTDKAAESSGAGAGRGRQGGPTMEELAAYQASRKVGAGAGRGVRGGPTAEELAGYRERKRLEEVDKPLERVYPEQAFIGGGSGVGLKGLYQAAKSLAGTGAKQAAETGGRALATKGADEAIFLGKTAPRAMTQTERLAGQTSPRLTYEEARAIAGSKAPPRLSPPPRQLTGPQKERALSEADWTGGAIGYKKGGKAQPAKKMASGGVTRSAASKRADGIASKGKTRGKIY